MSQARRAAWTTLALALGLAAPIAPGCGAPPEARRSRAAEVVVGSERASDAPASEGRARAGDPELAGAAARLGRLRIALDPSHRTTRLRSPRPEGAHATFVTVAPLLAGDFDGGELVHVDVALSMDDVATRAAYGASPVPEPPLTATGSAAGASASVATPKRSPAGAAPPVGATPDAAASATNAPPSAPSDPRTSRDAACAGLDLSVLAARTPRLTSLRVSGCRDALHAGLGTFGARLETLELADVELDDVLLDRIRQLTGLRALVFTRVRAGSVTPEALGSFGRAISVEHLVLRELETESVIADLLGDMPSLEVVQLEGAWAGHRAMTSLSKAKRLVALGLVDTNVGNFSLNQIEGLDRLREIEWVGATFNDYSPLHLRELPIERFRCACSRFGDLGVRHLVYLPRLQDLDLSQGRFQVRTLERLAELTALERLSLMDVTLDEPDLAGLAKLERLRVLVLGNASLVSPEAPHLGALATLRELHLDLEGFADPAAPALSTLTALEVLDLGAAPLSDDAIVALAPLSSLRVLLLHGSRVTNRGLGTVGALTSLERLDLDHTDVVDAGVARLSGLKYLRTLRLDHTLITDTSMSSLAALESLRELDVSHTVVTDAGVDALASRSSLERLEVIGTRTNRAAASTSPSTPNAQASDSQSPAAQAAAREPSN